ncbi:hypothetical protein APS56_06100 [Pseudalgibacter alginicilyticus]|uniref:Uncharacterized protein n=1 Tax=Pseudalgibacter alginicilyticus TaxID=1736674 RepID=A0A0P0DA86_9FLAO|nr:hypothetical protein [Pseudalgibacter alginicilyticus]ALJ04725.1 hypothetical protein APS56_06100 [Pseudalgibacter alginicilyticus]
MIKTSIQLFILFLLTSPIVLSQNQVELHVLKLSGNIPNGKISIHNMDLNGTVISSNYDAKIKLYPNIEFQTLEGFDEAFNEIGGEALMALPASLQDEVMTKLLIV